MKFSPRTITLVALVVVLALCSQSLASRSRGRLNPASIPPGLTRPIIAGSNLPDASEEVDGLKKILENEPAAASSMEKEGSDEPDLDAVLGISQEGDETVDGEEDATPETQVREAEEDAIKAEIDSLEKLITRAHDIVKVLPEKRVRLEELRKKLRAKAAALAGAKAAKQVSEQEGLLREVEEKIAHLKLKLSELNQTKAEIEARIKELQGHMPGAAPAADAAPAAEGEAAASTY